MQPLRPDYFAINPNRLDEEWIAQPRMYAEAAEQLAEARADHERAKAALELAEAEIEREVRASPLTFGIDSEKRPTESSIEKAVRVQRKYQRRVATLIEKKHAMDVMQGNVNTLDHRKAALQDLVRLRLADYYSEPRVAEGASRREVEQMENETMRRRRKLITREDCES